jgi:hypothetical protein
VAGAAFAQAISTFPPPPSPDSGTLKGHRGHSRQPGALALAGLAGVAAGDMQIRNIGIIG